jgi:pimeloyl-ACP methyl ester carboxylesterase
MTYYEAFETIRGCRIRLMRSGIGEPLLFLHGSSGAATWLPFMAKLAERFDVIVPEHPGFGASDTPEWLDNIGDLAFFYLDLIDHLGLERVHLVGGSIGGWIATELAIRDDSKLASLTLIAPAGIHVKGVSKGDIFMWSPEETARNLFHSSDMVQTVLSRTPTEEEEFTGMKNRLTTAKLTWQPRLYNPHLYKWMHRIQCPTLILWGAEDKVIPQAYGPAFQALIPGACLEILPDCGHLPQVECADEVVSKITRFATEVSQ